jgi:hypothetical protein
MNSAVMAGLVPAIHVFGPASLEDVDARDKRGHDNSYANAPSRHQPAAKALEGSARHGRAKCTHRCAAPARGKRRP